MIRKSGYRFSRDKRLCVCREIAPNKERREERADYFLRKRSKRTTVAPSLPRGGSSAAAGSAVVAGRAGDGGTAGSFAAGASAASCGSNCRPNCTDGSKKLLMAEKGTTSR